MKGSTGYIANYKYCAFPENFPTELLRRSTWNI
jgi:hypothetical protein